jgi:hypothetical protein
VTEPIKKTAPEPVTAPAASVIPVGMAPLAKPGSYIPGGFIDQYGRPCYLTPEIVRKLCPTATDAELTLMLYAAKTLCLNPFAHEIYFIKYKDQPAFWTVDFKEYLKRAGRSPHYQYYKLTITMDDKGIWPVEGTIKVYRNDRQALVRDENGIPYRDEKGILVWESIPTETTVLFREWAKYDRDHQGDNNFLQATWKISPRAMFEKALLKRGFVFAFPEEEWARLGMEDGDVQGVVVEGEVSEPAPKTTKILNAKSGKETEVDKVTGEVVNEDSATVETMKLLNAWVEQWTWTTEDLLGYMQTEQPGCVALDQLKETAARRIIINAQNSWTMFDGKLDEKGYPIVEAAPKK